MKGWHFVLIIGGYTLNGVRHMNEMVLTIQSSDYPSDHVINKALEDYDANYVRVEKRYVR